MITQPRLTSLARQVEIVVPVHNEQAALDPAIRRLHRFLSAEFPFSWRVVIADNASDRCHAGDRRPARLRAPGRGCGAPAARAAGARCGRPGRASRAEVSCYMDVDLSTDLRGLLPLVAPLLSGHSDLAIGTRLANGAPSSAAPSAS